MTPIPADAAFFQSLYDLDHDLFLKLKAKGCPHCGHPLDTSNYRRKTRGPGENENLRLSLCCRREGCRKRLTPPSLRFFDRKIYSRWVVVMAIDFGDRLGLLQKIPRQTLVRWRSFWKIQLAETSPFMKWARGFLPPGWPVTDRPASVIAAFEFTATASWVSILRFLSGPSLSA